MTDSAVTRPILPSADFTATADFYRLLGFEVTGQWPEYLIVDGPDDIQLHFWLKPDADRWTNDVACWIGYPSVDALQRRYDQWAGVSLPAPAQLNAPSDMADILVEFQVIDPHGNLLRLGAPKG